MKPVAYADAHAAPKEPLSFEAFLQQYEDAHAEWVNGEVVPKMPASVAVQRAHLSPRLWIPDAPEDSRIDAYRLRYLHQPSLVAMLERDCHILLPRLLHHP